MLSIIETTELPRKNFRSIGRGLHNYYLFYENKLSGEQMVTPHLYVLDSETQHVTLHAFRYHAHLTSQDNNPYPYSRSAIYYAKFEADATGGCFIEINKLQLDDASDICVGRFPLGEEVPLRTHINHSMLIAIDNRYCLLFMPNARHEYNLPFYAQIWLIDAVESASYHVTDAVFDDMEICHQLAQLFVTADGKHLVFKSGRIQPFEKRDIWIATLPNITPEKLLVVEASDLIASIKSQTRVTPVLDQSYGGNEAVGIIGQIDDKLLFMIENYDRDDTSVYSLNLTDLSLTKRYEKSELFMGIFAFGNHVYGVRENLLSECQDTLYYSFSEDTSLVFEENGGYLLYFDEDYTVSAKRNRCESPDEVMTHMVQIKENKNGKIKKWDEARYYYDNQATRLIIYYQE